MNGAMHLFPPHAFMAWAREILIIFYSRRIAGPSGRAVQGRSPAETVGSNSTGGMDVCRECCVLSDRGLCDELITRTEESHLLWCVVVCDLETS